MTKSKKPAQKSPTEKPVGKAVVTMPGRNGGRLNVGGSKSTGRPLDKVRALALQGLETAMPAIVKLANGGDNTEKVRHADQISAAKFLLDAGGGRPIVQTDVQERLQETLAVIARECPDATQYSRIIGALDLIWRPPVQEQGAI